MMPQPFLPSLPDARAILIRLGVVCLVLLLTLAGCGGSGWSSNEVEQNFRQSYPELALEAGTGYTISEVTCSKSEGNEFSCSVDVATTDGPKSYIVHATCEDECVWRDD